MIFECFKHKNNTKNKASKCPTCFNIQSTRRRFSFSEIKIPPDRPTDAYGELKFDSTGKTAKYVRVHANTKMDVLKDLLDTEWRLKMPNIMISVTGGAKNFKMQQNLTWEFRKSLIKAAESTGAWIITGGTHAGVMKIVGNAIQKHTTVKSSQIVTLGIATWGIVHDREKLQKKGEIISYKCEKSRSLDKNHTHFILVDDDSEKEFGREINLRTELESFIASDSKVQVVCVMVQGGHNSLKTVSNALCRGTPVVVVGGSGQWADILAIICGENSSSTVTEKDISKLLAEQGTDDVPPEDLSLWTNWAKECVLHKNLVHIFSLDNVEDIHDLDVAILQAILAGSAKDEENKAERHLKLALDWNRADIASSHILTDDAQIEPLVMLEYFETALLEGKDSFIKLFLDYGLELQTHFTPQKIVNLYKKTPENTAFRKIVNVEKEEDIEETDIFKALTKLLGPLYECNAFEEDINSSQGVLRHLFICCILQNKKECARHLWEAMREEELPACIIANRLLTSLSKRASIKEKKEELLEHAEIYQKHSRNILTVCYSKDPEDSTKLLKRRLHNWGDLTCLQVAVDAGDADFVAHQAVQMFLDKIWFLRICKDEQRNQILQSITIFICAFIPVLIPCLISFCQEKSDEDNENQRDLENGTQSSVENPLLSNSCANSTNKSGFKDFFKKVCSFYQAPVVKFHLTILSHLVFLTLFAYILLFNLFPTITFFEWILLVWVSALALDEIRQVYEVTPGHWISQFGNKLDVISFILYYIGFGLRFEYVDSARVLLSLAFIVFCLRILSVFSVHKQLGPKLLMVGKMLEDLFFFIFILLVFLIAYGVASQSLLYPNETDVGRVLEGILSKPYWNIYGELFLPEIVYNPTDDEFTCTNDTALIAQGQRRCPSQNVIVPIMSAVYLLLANVLLLNLLIAMFSYTFDYLVNKTDTIWKYQRHVLVQEYYNRSCFVVPLSVILYVPKYVRWICRRCARKDRGNTAFDHNFTGEELKRLVAWESNNADAYLTKFRSDERDTIDSKVQNVSERIDGLSTTVDTVRLNMKQQKKATKRIKALEAKLSTIDDSLGWIISALRDNDFLPKSLMKPVHIRARMTPYPKSDVKRYPLSDQMVSWNVPLPEYNPPHYTAPKFLATPKPPYADDNLNDGDGLVSRILPFNKYDSKENVDRESRTGVYDVVDGLPRNPGGRTGLTGRGLLGRYGPNHAADPIVTRWKRNENGEIEKRNGKHLLEFVAIQRKDTKEWAIPGGMVNAGEYVGDTLKREFLEEVEVDGPVTEDKDSTFRKVKEFFRTSSVEIFQGYCDDHRNTDCAWIETIACNFHDKDGTVFQQYKLRPGEEAVGVTWVAVEDSLALFADHKKYIERVASLHKAYFKPQAS